jgi:hypothetical protein
MDARIPASFWSDPALENQAPEIRLTLLWQLTHYDTNLCGAYRFSPSRFALDTGLDPSWHEKTLAAFPERFVLAENWVLILSYVQGQVGDLLGRGGRWNNLAKALAKPFGLLPSLLQQKLHALHPDLEALMNGTQALTKPLPRASDTSGSPYQALAKPLPRASEAIGEALTKPLPRASDTSGSPYQGLSESAEALTKGPIRSTPSPHPHPHPHPGGVGGEESFDARQLDYAGAARLLDYLDAQTGVAYPHGRLELDLAGLALCRGPEEEVRRALWRQVQLFRGTDKAHFLRPAVLLEPQRFGTLFAERDLPLPGAAGRSKRVDQLQQRLASETLSPEERAALREQIEQAQTV